MLEPHVHWHHTTDRETSPVCGGDDDIPLHLSLQSVSISPEHSGTFITWLSVLSYPISAMRTGEREGELYCSSRKHLPRMYICIHFCCYTLIFYNLFKFSVIMRTGKITSRTECVSRVTSSRTEHASEIWRHDNSGSSNIHVRGMTKRLDRSFR
jgi:hypothetical protein